MESKGLPLLKNLPKYRDGFIKVKVRQKRVRNRFIDTFNDAFKTERTNLIQRAVFAYGETGLLSAPEDSLEPFYIFPVDGYKYLYNPLSASTEEYESTLNKLLENVGETAPDLFQQMLKYDYISDNLAEGISKGSEIIIHGIPYYFALRKTIIDDYSNFLVQ
jgi:hypothetical protein